LFPKREIINPHELERVVGACEKNPKALFSNVKVGLPQPQKVSHAFIILFIYKSTF
jgi:hypothetical protein